MGNLSKAHSNLNKVDEAISQSGWSFKWALIRILLAFVFIIIEAVAQWREYVNAYKRANR